MNNNTTHGWVILTGKKVGHDPLVGHNDWQEDRSWLTDGSYNKKTYLSIALKK